MLIKNNCLIISKNKDKDVKNMLLLYTLCTFQHRLSDCNLCLILNEQYEADFRRRILNTILYLTQVMEYHSRGKIQLFSSDKKLIADFNDKKNIDNTHFNKLETFDLKDLMTFGYLNDDLSLNSDSFSEITKISDNNVNIYVPEISNIPTIRV